MTAFSLVVTNLHSRLFCSVIKREMAQLALYANTKEKYLVFSGVRLHKKGFLRKGKPSRANAAVVAGVVESDLSVDDAEVIIKRMADVRKGFQSYINHYITSWWVSNAMRMGMRMTQTGKPVQSYEEMVQELESNSTMQNFQNWYTICYRDTDIKSAGKLDAETKIMNNLAIVYHDNTVTGGCVGDLLSEQINKQLGKIQNRSRNKQLLHLVKSRPQSSVRETPGMNRKPGLRRTAGEYFVVRSDRSGKPVEWSGYNVRYWWKSTVCLVIGCLTKGCDVINGLFNVWARQRRSNKIYYYMTRFSIIGMEQMVLVDQTKR
jgi:hypothetical protein